MYILSAKGMKMAEKTADERGIDYYTLMKNAGNSAADHIAEKEELSLKKTVILCGNGNNGGDGFVMANRLFKEGADVTVALLLGYPKTDCAKKAFEALDENVKVVSAEELYGFKEIDILVDALFGTGFKGELSGDIIALFDYLKPLSKRIYAVDLPSGVTCDTGEASNGTLPADCTITFAALKYCHVLPPSNGLCAETVVMDIGIEEEILKENCDSVFAILPPVFKKRDKNSHKGSFGTLLAVVGSYGMPGAAIISCRAALKSGIGILKIASPKENYAALATACPEGLEIPLCSDASDKDSLEAALKGSTALLIGCGVGRSEAAAENTAFLLENTTVTTVIDADGINNLACRIDLIKKVKAPLVLTPHPGEMARLTGKTVEEVEKDRLNIARSFATENKVWLCLKGANTIVAAPDGRLFVNLNGNPGMASGGSGDMLAGLMAGFAAYMDLEQAILSAVWLHSDAGDRARDKYSEISMTVSDMLEEL